MDALRGSEDGLLRTADLAARDEFALGEALVDPATRTIIGPGGTTSVEPRVMQVLLVLADSAGYVVTRDVLFQRCWGGVYVGDDSLNRVIAAVRKLAGEIGGGSFVVETVPRTGYRLNVLHGSRPRATGGAGAASSGVPRRKMLAGGIAGAAAIGGFGLWSTLRSRRDAKFDDLMKHAETAARSGAAYGDHRAIGIVEQAISIRPGSARAWGLLALFESVRAQSADPTAAPGAVDRAQSAVSRALAIDSREPNALLAMVELQGSTLDWITRDRRLRQIIAIDPENLLAISELVLLLQATGLSRESWNWNERALAIEPLSDDFLCKRALKLWIAGRVSEADKVVDQVRALYPDNPGPWWVRFLILALSGRPRAAQAMLDSNPAGLGSPNDVALWRPALAALDRKSAELSERVRAACFRAAEIPGGSAGEAVMILSALGLVDAAFDAVNGFLLSRGSVVRRDRPEPKQGLNDAVSRINTQWLFTPPCAAMRADPRFLPLCDAMGLADYWRRRGVKPDYLTV